VHIPSLGGATEWLDTEPLGPAELRGHVVLVNFWTWTCISWLRQEPYVRRGRRPTETTGWLSSASTPWPTPCRTASSGRRLGYWWGPGRIRPLRAHGALAVVLCRRSKLRRLAERTPRTLISMGVVDHEALRKERLTEDQLMAAIATQGAGDLDDVAEAVLLPQRNDRDSHEGDGPRRQALHGPHEQLDELKAMVAGLGPASAGPQRSA
jgi:hypothetical protein